MDLVAQIIEYESGVMDESQTIEFFQALVDDGLAWQLQGSYGRLAADLIRSGHITYEIKGE
ncbi:hypothetical protein LCGC14_2042760 [marine sediment metagenome]|uniref:DUF7417 domain-containing protein n=1 Tax=marine sediment metagenome TaxID=412755 RepID=A0A0F9ER82_9ZZZZ